MTYWQVTLSFPGELNFS
uniref:Uncharacterized protein n=1 Tax=Anguilla anguilla TaxID=7936 RepID=A0A0E9UK63_ANGAN